MSRTLAQADDAAATGRFLVHGPGLPAQGALVHIAFGAHSLRCEEPQGEVEVPFATLTTRPGGWNGESLLLEWDGPQGPRSVLLDRPERFAGLVESLPQDMRQRLEGWRREVRRNRRLLHAGLVVVMAVTLLPLFAISILMLNADAIARRAVARIPLQWEQALGDQALRDLRLGERVRTHGPAFDSVQRVANDLVQHSPTARDWDFLLVEDPRQGAVALPGGTILLWTGLLREMRSEAELAGVLAHEMQHVVLRQSLQGAVHQLGMRKSLGIVLLGEQTLGAVDAAMAAPLPTLTYTRDQEDRARAAARDLLRRAGRETTGFATLLQRLDARSHELPAMLTTHPSSSGRTGVVDALAADTQVPSAWQAVLDDVHATAGAAPEVQP